MSEVTYSREDKVAHIRLNAGERGNTFSPSLRREVNQAIQRYKADEDAWIAIVSGDGPDFCVGSADGGVETPREARERTSMWAGGFIEVWKPLIAAVQGSCRGEGFALALSCDLRVADDTATFAADFFGHAQSDAVAVWLTNLVGLSATFELLWLDRTLDAHDARKVGLVNRIVSAGEVATEVAAEQRFPMEVMKSSVITPEGDALGGARELAKELLQYAPVTRNFQKETAYRSIGVPFHYAQTLELGPNPYASEDRIEGTRAFVENRRPLWRNR